MKTLIQIEIHFRGLFVGPGADWLFRIGFRQSGFQNMRRLQCVWFRDYESPIEVTLKTQAYWERQIEKMLRRMHRVQYCEIVIMVASGDRRISYDENEGNDERYAAWTTTFNKKEFAHHRVTGPAWYVGPLDTETADWKNKLGCIEEFIIEDEACGNFSWIQNENDLVRYIETEQHGILVAKHLVESGAVKVSQEFEENLKMDF